MRISDWSSDVCSSDLTESGYFTFLPNCAPDADIILGDARLKIAGLRAATLDVLAIDAFSSDSVPMHLLTREAFGVYARALRPRGILLVHISNRYLDLEPDRKSTRLNSSH